MIKNIIFDLGGVIIDVDTKKALEAFKKLQKPGDNQIDTNTHPRNINPDLFDSYEKGQIPSEELRESLKTQFRINITDEEFDLIMNKLFVETSFQELEEKLTLIKQLKDTDYQTFLLSNLTEIHVVLKTPLTQYIIPIKLD